MLVWPMLACGDSVNMFSQGAASIRRIQEIFKEQPAIADTDKTKDVDDIKGEIDFHHLTFIHRGHSEPTLNDPACACWNNACDHRAHRKRKIHTGKSPAAPLQHETGHAFH